jgi:pseudouridine-5'-phosphate glycosidase
MSASVAETIQEALDLGKPVVALETAVLTAGLPKSPWSEAYGDCPHFLDCHFPINLALANAMSESVKNNGAIPAWIALVDGELRVGLSDVEIVDLCKNKNTGKVSLATIAQSMHSKKTAGTTVATTLLACRLSSKENPIRVFATGGIGGLHQNWMERLDISADLLALSNTPTCVVASGAKSILDIPATVEALETIGVPVLGLGTSLFPRFIESNKEEDPAITQVDLPSEIASICKKHWFELQLRSAVLATVPVPDEVALEVGTLDRVIACAEEEWVAAKQAATTRTPFLLDRLTTLTQGKSLVANLALLCNNAIVAAQIAIALAK